MSRNALEGIIQQIAEKISENRNDTIPANKSGYIAPYVYRQYLHTTTFISCYAAKLYSHKFLNSCGTGILPVSFIQIKCTTA
jgi:hypothetical protein